MLLRMLSEILTKNKIIMFQRYKGKKKSYGEVSWNSSKPGLRNKFQIPSVANFFELENILLHKQPTCNLWIIYWNTFSDILSNRYHGK